MKILKLPTEVQYNFEGIYKLRLDSKSKIILFDKDTCEFREREIFRSYMSYGNTPDFNTDIKKSYMFLNKSNFTPKELIPFFDYAKSIDNRYNQMVINFYEPDEYIEAHRDCTSSFLFKEAPILMINLNETDNIYKLRNFHMVCINTGVTESVPLLNNHVYFIENNLSHRHYTGMGVEKRISITFRMVKE